MQVKLALTLELNQALETNGLQQTHIPVVLDEQEKVRMCEHIESVLENGFVFKVKRGNGPVVEFYLPLKNARVMKIAQVTE